MAGSAGKRGAKGFLLLARSKNATVFCLVCSCLNGMSISFEMQPLLQGSKNVNVCASLYTRSNATRTYELHQARSDHSHSKGVLIRTYLRAAPLKLTVKR